MVYGLLLDSYFSPEIHYKRLMERCPNLKEAIPLKNIASFLGLLLKLSIIYAEN